MFMTTASLRTGRRGSTGALATYLAGASDTIGQAHHLIWSLFGDMNGDRPFLYRQTGPGLSKPVLIYSRIPVSDAHGLWDIETKEFSLLDELAAGDEVVWSIRVNATFKHGNKRHDIVARARREAGEKAREVGDARIPSVDELAAIVVPDWLKPRLAAAGLETGAMSLVSHGTQRFSHGLRDQHRQITMTASDLRGNAKVIDPEALRAAAEKGIGPGKAYGCGMLLMRRAV